MENGNQPGISSVSVTDVALRLVPTVAELQHSFHLSFSISQLSFPISPALKPIQMKMENGRWKMMRPGLKNICNGYKS